MTLDLLLALAGFAFVMSISPGPGNFLLLASGANFGFPQSIPLILGISFGLLSMVAAVGLGAGLFLKSNPAILNTLRLACVVYVLWLAWRIARTQGLDAGSAARAAKPIRFHEAALLQLLNPKAWAVALIATVSYTVPDNYLASLALLIVTFAMVNLPSISVWAISGLALQRFLSTRSRLRGFNIAMALLLVVSMVPVLMGSIAKE